MHQYSPRTRKSWHKMNTQKKSAQKYSDSKIQFTFFYSISLLGACSDESGRNKKNIPIYEC